MKAVFRAEAQNAHAIVAALLRPAPSSSPSPKMILSPMGTFRPGRTSVSQVSGESCRTSRTSIGALQKFAAQRDCSRPARSAWIPRRWPKRRAGSTRALLTTMSSSPRSRSGNSRNWRSSQAPDARSRSSIREASRSASGRCAIRSGGKSKSNSLRFICSYVPAGFAAGRNRARDTGTSIASMLREHHRLALRELSAPRDSTPAAALRIHCSESAGQFIYRRRETVAEGSVVISPRGVERIRLGHLWVYRSDVRTAQAEPGAVVRLTDERGRFHGRAFYSDKSQIAVRLLTREDVPVDRAFFTERLRSRPIAYRQRIVENTEAYRVVYSEGDLLPSLIVDRYGDYLVVQTLSQGTERHKELLVEILVELLSPKGILERNDPKVRLLEGLEQRVSVLHGEIPAGNQR